MEKLNEYQCEHLSFIVDADGPMFMVKVKGHDRHWYLRFTNGHARLIAADSTGYVCNEMQKAEGRAALE